MNTYVERKIKKCNKITGLTKRLSVYILWNASLTIYKSFIRPHIHYVVVSYDKSKKINFYNKIEKVQYKACLAITRAIQGTSIEKLTIFAFTNK